MCICFVLILVKIFQIKILDLQNMHWRDFLGTHSHQRPRSECAGDLVKNERALDCTRRGWETPPQMNATARAWLSRVRWIAALQWNFCGRIVGCWQLWQTCPHLGDRSAVSGVSLGARAAQAPFDYVWWGRTRNVRRSVRKWLNPITKSSNSSAG